MHFLICIAGLPRLVAEEVRATSPAVFTQSKSNPPIVHDLAQPYAYRHGMAEFFLTRLSERLEAISPREDVGIGLIYADLGGARAHLLDAFFPFAVAMPVAACYPDTWEKARKREELRSYLKRLTDASRRVRETVLLIRDTLSGQNFSPLTLPLYNFRSNVLVPRLRAVYDELGTTESAVDLVRQVGDVLLDHHPLERMPDRVPYFRDARGLRFKSPGQNKHAFARVVGAGHRATCLINGRARLGGPLRAGFHYDCDYERGGLDSDYPNCHGSAEHPARTSHVNIAPNDAIR